MTDFMNDLKTFWNRLLGRTPSDQQFEFWSIKHNPEIIKEGILKTAQKNLGLGGTMSDDHRIRFASKVMNTLSVRKEVYEGNREELCREFEGAGSNSKGGTHAA